MSTSNGLKTAASMVFLAILPAIAGCHLIAPSCHEETGTVFHVAGEVPPDGVTSYTVTSPKDSNLLMRLTWPDTTATLGLRATITDCGGHAGCSMATITPPFGPGGSSPVPQPWPAGLREMLVDGWKGKTYRVEISGDPVRGANVILDVSYQIRCES